MSESNKKPRSYYVDYSRNRGKFNKNNSGSGSNSKYKSTPELAFGNRGFLLTSVDEVKSYFEMRNILEDYYAQLYPESDEDKVVKSEDDQAVCEDEIESELKQLRKFRPFKQVKTNCRNTLFLNITKDFSKVNPILMCDKFYQDLALNRDIKCINTFKFMPILDTFRISLSCAKESLANIIEEQLDEKDLEVQRTYFIEFQSRGNYKLSSEDRQKWIEGIAKKISDLRPQWSVDREKADYMIVLIALKDVCCITFLKDYFKRAKYNVIELCKDFSADTILGREEES